MKFDWRCTSHAKDQPGVALVLGYNTAVLGILLRAAGKPLFTNMDGIEWKRAKWPFHGRVWLYLNEWLGALSSTRLIADHPEIARHLARRRAARDIVMIPYGADPVLVASDTAVRELGLTPSKYMLSIGRIEPENNILPMIRSFVSRPGKFQFVCIGKLEPENNLYHASVIKAADGRVIFPGAIYEADRVKALRFYAGAYCHGHSVGGTNPSLVEALGSGNVIIAHDNCYNRWVAGDDQFYFSSDADCAAAFDVVEAGGELVEQAKFAARKRFDLAFHWGPILEEYLALMVDCASV
jgi:glycosyltransferase involved in cell wall biosynthesis